MVPAGCEVIIDSSAILSVVFKESAAERLAEVMVSSSGAAVGAPTLAETAIVLGSRLGFERRGLLFRFIQEFEIATIPFTGEHWSVAVEAYERYGKGRHSAALNFGDCLTYAVAKVARQPLLFVGDDFRETDLQIVSY